MRIESAHRLAVYYAPPADHPLWDAGCTWLGRDAAQPQRALVPVCAWAAAPRRYGFHATLKPPCRLREPAGASAFVEAVAQLASTVEPFEMPPLDVGWLGDFMALRPREPFDGAHPIVALARRCVIDLDPWRAPPSESELRRRERGLTQRQQTLLQRYGYPYVLDEWRFHMTLTDGLAPVPARRGELTVRARRHFAAALARPLHCRDLAIFAEPAAGEPFVLVQRCPLGTR